MPLTDSQALERFEEIRGSRDREQTRLDRIRSYMRDDLERRLQGLPSGVPQEVHRLARLSRVNLLKFVVNSRVQSMYVDGYRAPGLRVDGEANPIWEVWQANGFDARQIGVHRAALAYGASYVTVLPGDPVPVIRGASPRHLTALYDDDDVWPVWALEKRRPASGELWRFWDNEAVYWIRVPKDSDRPEVTTVEIHNAKWNGKPIVPIVRYRDTVDLDDPVVGAVEPLIPLQDQINVTTFGLQVAQHFTAFKLRYIIGWTAEDEAQAIRVAADKLMMFEDENVKVGELSETNLSGYIESRKSTIEQLATISQTPAHELLGQLINLSAEALAAAEASARRAITENQTVLGESHEQVLGLVGQLMDDTEPDPLAYVRWRDTEARSLSQLVDALGKAVTMLGIPPQELWDRVADAMGVSQQELEQWKRGAESGDAFAQLEQFLDRQSNPAPV